MAERRSCNGPFPYKQAKAPAEKRTETGQENRRLRVQLPPEALIYIIKRKDTHMNQEKFFKGIFAIIVVANILLAAWNYMKGDFVGFLISALVVILWAAVAFGMTKFVINK
jgi:hypothetical protein